MATKPRNAPARQTVTESESSEAVLLPASHDLKHVAPSILIRSSLFAVIESKDRQFVKAVVLVRKEGMVVKFTGQQLNQSDLDVWEGLVHLARDSTLGTIANFTAGELLTELGLPTGDSQNMQLQSTLIRLTACAVEVTCGGKTYFGPLIKSGAKEGISRHYNIELNKELIRLFGENQWTALDWQQRRTLCEKPLAQALHAFYSSQGVPSALKLVTLYELFGSRNTQFSNFLRDARRALQMLVEVGFFKSFSIEGDTVSVVWAAPQLEAG